MQPALRALRQCSILGAALRAGSAAAPIISARGGIERLLSVKLGCFRAYASVRSGGGVLGWRVFAVDGLKGFAPHSELAFDGPPGSDAARLVAYAYAGANATWASLPASARVGLFVAGAPADSDEAALAFLDELAAVTLTQRFAGGVWGVDAVGALRGWAGGLNVSAGLNVTSEGAAWRRVGGRDFVVPPGGVLDVGWGDGTSRAITP